MNKKMKLLIFSMVIILMFVTACSNSTVTNKKATATNQTEKTTREIIDMTGRKVTIPAKVNKVISLSNNTTVDVFTLAPDKLLGWSFAPKPEAKKFITDKYFNLPLLGATTEKSDNFENILKLKPDLIIASNEDEVYPADNIQKQLKIPVVVVDTAVDATDKVYTFLGDCLGEEKRAKELADYSRKVLDNIKELVKKVPADKKAKVYYAEGTNWLQTDISGNVHTEVLDFSGGKNVADISEAKVGSMANVSMEQVMNWNPDVILVGATAMKGDFYSKVYKDTKWGNIKAVKDKNIYMIPSLPFNWFDRPPSAVRVLGVEWLANLLYPEYVNIDINKEIKNFYSTFYNYNLTDDELKDLLKNATLK
ncbi:ABC transporter substrate-binding protein [Clostridiaceae bacterium UIB06]|uniref:ABC transporter substrate-binding protein n=1 Tax=Clostridium thailandense TaxID=2794346 RepID=A0A949TQU5_9CLOT|nr:ABC transporter substrate-binding protein [Clostridium thailandense]MBV7273717.1 ABC transporter substrate-binding protein [Clostridium thailandense]MCH5137503.1 ABC transporter substrate-binding protein [Clostridiaceae bacterium UIB06]